MTKKIAFITILIFLMQTFIALAIEKKLSEINEEKFWEIAKEQTSKEEIELYTWKSGRFAALYSEKGDSLSGYFILTSDYDKTKGYQGPTAVGLELDAKGKILSAEIVESTDTRTYVRKIERKNFLENFLGLGAEDEIEAAAVSSATKTCEAIQKSIENTLKIFDPFLENLSQEEGKLKAAEEYELKKIEMSK